MKKKFVLIALFFLFLTSIKLNAQEARFKAIMLYQFTKLVGWPTLQLEDPNTNFVIGIYGDQKLAELTEYYTKGKKVGASPILVEYYATVKDINKCQILYIDYSKTKYLPLIIQRVGERTPTLITTSRPGALNYGAIANFVIQDNLMKVELNTTIALQRQLQISYQLQKAAVKVIEP
jgi:hypothetical protein